MSTVGDISFKKVNSSVKDDTKSERSAAHGSRTSKSRSKASRCGSGKSISSERIQLMKDEAVLKIEQGFHDEETSLILEEAKLVQRRRELARQKEMAAKKAEQEVLEQIEEDASAYGSSIASLGEESKAEGMERFFTSQEKDTPPPHLEANQPPVTHATPPGFHEGWREIASSLAQLAQASMFQNAASQQMALSTQLPKIEVPSFSGDPLQYSLWESGFDSLIASKPIDDGSKLNFLHRYMEGEPRELVEHYLLIKAKDGYNKARHALAERYGNSSTISAAYSEKLSSWPKIGNKDGKGLRNFSDFLEKVAAAKVTVSSLDILDFPQENVKLLGKLPSFLEGRWKDEVQNWRERHRSKDFPPFEMFAAFVKKAADRDNMPEFATLGKESAQPVRETGFPRRNPKARSFTTNGSSEGNRGGDKSKAGQYGTYSSCPYCEGHHKIDDCKEFMQLDMGERKSFFFHTRLCMGCGMSDSHRFKQCAERKSCTECGGNHLACLHYSTKKAQVHKEEGTAKCTSVCSIPDQNGKEHCMIIPVWVRHVNDRDKESLEYAILDDQSNVCFVAESLCQKIGISGTDTDLQLTTMHSSTPVKCQKIAGLEVQDFKKDHAVKLPSCYTREVIPASRSQIPKCDVIKKWPHLRKVADDLMPYSPGINVSLLIGNNCPSIIRPREVICGGEDDPYAQRSLLGWGVIGRVCKTAVDDQASCHKISADSQSRFITPMRAKEVISPARIIQALEADFKEENTDENPHSVQDERFLAILEDGIKKRQDGHYEMPLPFKEKNVSLPNNRPLAEKRWNQLSARLRKNEKFRSDYVDFMKDVITTCAERAPPTFTSGKVNYVPHTGVYHPKKRDKIRVVFDCSARYQGTSLNDCLLQGPDLTNGLLGVLCRFRQEEVAFMADIKSMFHQFHVREEDRDMLRFLWWEDGDLSKDVVEYCMSVHLFGASSSPGCANFGLKKAASDGEETFGEDASNFIRKEFYVDDGLKSVGTSQEAVSLLKAAQGICAEAGLKLHKIMSNKKEVLEQFPVEERAKGVADLNLDTEPLPLERALGVVWCVENDSLEFRIELRDRPLTRRGILSTVCSIYDPSGFASPVTLKGKQILQLLCKLKLDWDSPIPDDMRPQWEKWRMEIGELEKLSVPRCYKPANFGKVKAAELHHFSDASQSGYGQCSYLRLVNEKDEVATSLVIAKSRVAPLKPVTIPRLELAAAVVSAKMSAFLRKELSYTELREFFWSDSKLVLGYIKNEARRFHTFVANRVQQIHEVSTPSSWFHIDTSANPADDASRGLTAKELLQCNRWSKGPAFLHVQGEFQTPQEGLEVPLADSDPEVKRASSLSTRIEDEVNFDSNRLLHISSWNHAKRAIALCLRLKKRLQKREVRRVNQADAVKPVQQAVLNVAELKDAEMEMIRSLQKEHFSHELKVLQKLNVGEDCDRGLQLLVQIGSIHRSKGHPPCRRQNQESQHPN